MECVLEEVLVLQKSLTFHRSSPVWMTAHKRMQRRTAGVLEKSITYLGGSSKSNFINVVMGRNCSSSCGAVAWHNVHHTWRETHLKQRLKTAL